MNSAIVAWGKAEFIVLNDDDAIWGHQFELNTSGTQFNAQDVLHGIMGFRAQMTGKKIGKLTEHNKLVVCGMRNTRTSQLKPYLSLLAERFQQAEQGIYD